DATPEQQAEAMIASGQVADYIRFTNEQFSGADANAEQALQYATARGDMAALQELDQATEDPWSQDENRIAALVGSLSPAGRQAALETGLLDEDELLHYNGIAAQQIEAANQQQQWQQFEGGVNANIARTQEMIGRIIANQGLTRDEA